MSIDREDGSQAVQHSLIPLLPWLLLAAALSVSMMVLGVGRGDRLLPALSAGLFASLVVGTGLGINAPLWSRAEAAVKAPSLVRSALRCNVWLAALMYAWGASALFGMYSLSDLVWRHAFQYAGGASLFAAGIALYGFSLGRSGGAGIPPIVLTALHGLAAIGGLLYLTSADKLSTLKSDWAANEVFLWGGFAIIALCMMSALTQWRVTRPGTEGAASP
jgi:hypothetical protein